MPPSTSRRLLRRHKPHRSTLAIARPRHGFRVGRADPIEGSEPVTRRYGPRPQRKCHLEQRFRRDRCHADQRPRIDEEKDIEQTRDRQHGAQFHPHRVELAERLIEIHHLDDAEIVNAPTTLARTPTTASVNSPALMAATNTYHLAKKPAKGGMPASENSSIAKKNASNGLVRESPAKSLIFSTC